MYYIIILGEKLFIIGQEKTNKISIIIGLILGEVILLLYGPLKKSKTSCDFIFILNKH